jgi:hypothetical protein
MTVGPFEIHGNSIESAMAVEQSPNTKMVSTIAKIAFFTFKPPFVLRYPGCFSGLRPGIQKNIWSLHLLLSYHLLFSATFS